MQTFAHPICYNIVSKDRVLSLQTFSEGEIWQFSPFSKRRGQRIMRLADELRSQESEPIVPDYKQPSKEEIDKIERYQAIVSGTLVEELVQHITNVLRQDLYSSRLMQTPMDKHYVFHCIYRQSDYCKKEKAYRNKYINGEEQTALKSVKQREMLQYYLPHRVFDLNEIECLKRQIAKAMNQEGFQVSFNIKEFKYKICNGFGLAIHKQSYGYTMDFTVRW